MFKNIYSFLFVVTLTGIISSCSKSKDAQIPPNISFKTDSGYVSADMIVPTDTTIYVGINASKSEGNDIVTKINVTRTYDSTADSLIKTINIPTAQGNSFSTFDTIHVRSIAGTEKYSYTVINRDGITNTVKFTLTVQ